MKPIQFPEQNVIFAKDQPEYEPLPAFIDRSNPSGPMVCAWQLSFRERLKVLFSGVVWQMVLTFNEQLQPQFLTVEKSAVLSVVTKEGGEA